MSRERKILSHPLSKPSVQKKVEEAFREVKKGYRDAKDGRLVKKSSDKKR